jgi:hypothetical protein
MFKQQSSMSEVLLPTREYLKLLKKKRSELDALIEETEKFLNSAQEVSNFNQAQSVLARLKIKQLTNTNVTEMKNQTKKEHL